MYGTIARMQIRPGMREAFLDWTRSTIGAGREVPGHIELFAYQMDADPNTLMLAVVFESRESYHANAGSAEQHAEYLKMMEFLAAEPEWNDGEIIWHG